MNIFLARQPVYDAELNVVAYELLYRSNENNYAGDISDPDQASSQVISNAFFEFGMEQIVGDMPALVNVTKSFLAANQLPNNLSDKLVLEILETETVDNELVKLVDELAHRGYQIALDDFEFDRDWALLVPKADIIKYDVMALGKDGMDKQLFILERFQQKFGQIRAKLLAEKVETHEEFEHYKALGFDYFQGYFMSKPKIIKDKGVPASKMVVVSLLGELNNPNADVDNIELLISQDARLTYKMLRVVNSAAFSLATQVDTIRQAIVVIGLDELRRWASLMALSLNDGKSNELLVTAMIRARMCQILSEKKMVDDTNVYFTAGLFSLMDALMDAPLAEILEPMPFSDELKSGVIELSGCIGETLKAVLAYEKGDWSHIDIPGIDGDDISGSYMQSLEWTKQATNNLLGD